jgi:serine phosphatase RsbU (regulator of sigma subunit)
MQVIRSKRSRSAREIVESVVREVREFAGSEQFEDDLTLIVVKVVED